MFLFELSNNFLKYFYLKEKFIYYAKLSFFTRLTVIGENSIIPLVVGMSPSGKAPDFDSGIS